MSSLRFRATSTCVGRVLIVYFALGLTQIGTAGVIEGRVIDESGNPIADASVELHEWNWKWPKAPRKLHSAADGSYRFEELDERVYRVLTKVEGRVLAMQHLGVGEGGDKTGRTTLRSASKHKHNNH